MHEDIGKFSLDGELSDNNLLKSKERHILFLEQQMRDTGFVPALDLEPQFTLDYQPEKETYKFELTVYGVFVGNENTSNIAGVSAGKKIYR